MNIGMIEKYIDKLTVNHIKEYAKLNQIELINNEADSIYEFIKNNYRKLYLEDYNEDLLKELKCKISLNNYQKILNLYKETKEKIRN